MNKCRILLVETQYKEHLFITQTLDSQGFDIDIASDESRVKKGTSIILCFYRQEIETFKEKHKIIDVPFLPQNWEYNDPNQRCAVLAASAAFGWLDGV